MFRIAGCKNILYNGSLMSFFGKILKARGSITFTGIRRDKLQFLLKQLDIACTKFNQKDLRRILLDAVDDFKPQCGIKDYFWLNGTKKNKNS
jgi:hypothetical protein